MHSSSYPIVVFDLDGTLAETAPDLISSLNAVLESENVAPLALEQARNLVCSGDFATLNLLYDNVPAVLSELIRTAFVPRIGRKLIVADFSSIEAVVLAWLACEKWTLEAYAQKRDLYIENAEIMFGAPKGSIDKKSPMRQKSKIAVLACGYQGSVGALKAFGALEMGLEEEELKPLVDAWRAANPNIVRFWWDADKAAKDAVMKKTTTETRGIWFSMIL